MLPEVPHVIINIELGCTIIDIRFHLSHELLINLFKFNQVLHLFAIFLSSSWSSGYFLFYCFFVLDVLLSNMVKKVPEKTVVVYY